MSSTLKEGSRVDSHALKLVGATIGKYRLVRIVGQGGMGTVFEAVNTAINKRVAMKCIDSELAKNDEAIARFQREALAASAVESPHIIQIFDAGDTDDGTPYIVMELLRGEDLGLRITELGRLPVNEALRVTIQILKGLHHAHTAGIIHRDLKPDNVFLVAREDEPELVKLLDFGVSKIAQSEDVPLQTLTRQGTVVGTPFYMSPEQAQAYPDVDSRTDLYSVGAILYECLTGRPPHTGKAYEQVIVNICMKDAEDVRTLNDTVPDGVAKLIHKALARERDDRYGSAREMLEDIVDKAADSLTGGTPSSILRGVSLGGAMRSEPGVTPFIISSNDSTSELADTVTADSGTSEAVTSLGESGVNEKADIATSTVRSPDTGSKQPDQRRWPIALVALGAVVLAVGLYFGFAGKAQTPTAETHSPSTDGAPPASSSSLPPAASTTAAAPLPTATPSSPSAMPSSNGSVAESTSQPTTATGTRPPPPTPRKSAEPKPPPTPTASTTAPPAASSSESQLTLQPK